MKRRTFERSQRRKRVKAHRRALRKTASSMSDLFGEPPLPPSESAGRTRPR